MWLNDEKVSGSAVCSYRKSLLDSCPNHVVIDGLFDEKKLDEVLDLLGQEHCWQTQQHTYSTLYADREEWEQSSQEERFVQRDLWRGQELKGQKSCAAQEFLSFLRGDEFMSFLSRIFNVILTDMSVADPLVNTNYFRLGSADFVELHADDSPGRELCMLLYLNKDWRDDSGGELAFVAEGDEPLKIAPLYNRCVLFDPSSEGSEHWVEKLKSEAKETYRYNVTSWYWSE